MNKTVISEDFFDETDLNFADDSAEPLKMKERYILITEVDGDDIVACVDQYSLVTGKKLFDDVQFELLSRELLQVIARAASDKKFTVEIRESKDAL